MDTFIFIYFRSTTIAALIIFLLSLILDILDIVEIDYLSLTDAFVSCYCWPVVIIVRIVEMIRSG